MLWYVVTYLWKKKLEKCIGGLFVVLGLDLVMPIRYQTSKIQQGLIT